MKIIRPYHFRTWLISLLVVTSLFTFLVVGTIILLVKIPQIRHTHQTAVVLAADEITNRIETVLNFVESDLELVGHALAHMPERDLQSAISHPQEGRFDAFYLIHGNGQLAAAYIRNADPKRWQELTGLDLSRNILFQEATISNRAIWSDRYLSVISGQVTEAVAIRASENGDVIIGELSIRQQINLDHSFASNRSISFAILDSNGEIIADSDPEMMRQTYMPQINQVTQTATRDKGARLGHAIVNDVSFDVASNYSNILGWYFTARVTTGLDNPEILSLTEIVVACFGGSLIIGLIMVPFWAHVMVSPLNGIVEHASSTARGETIAPRKSGSVQEFNRLSSDLDRLALAVHIRQQELARLNDGLEQRVHERTAELEHINTELSSTLQALSLTQDELVQSEKMAALGRLVAGIAHELNTPLGNGRMAVTTLADQNITFAKTLENGLRKSDLTDYIAQVQTLTTMIERNIMRAGDLVSSFKQVAVDRTSSHRRRFSITEVIDEIILTLTPSLKNRPVSIEKHIEADVTLDSFPGEFGQIITNLIDNALVHAFEPDQDGTVAIHVIRDKQRENSVILEVRDNGKGMTDDVLDHIFDPFFTTRMGTGGTGLGLSITSNAVNSLLGGTISATSAPGEGTCFRIICPMIAPENTPAT
ncbi:sensor histidine kinase [Thalassospira mesophila]|uniref:sensor histidine kinase n=1 Tax=Thalassospira mesophila TaxID=1293891 RepID=UPI000A1DFD1A|nr:sensor histidine kinase [Thalassospira mesophila]